MKYKIDPIQLKLLGIEGLINYSHIDSKELESYVNENQEEMEYMEESYKDEINSLESQIDDSSNLVDVILEMVENHQVNIKTVAFKKEQLKDITEGLEQLNRELGY